VKFFGNFLPNFDKLLAMSAPVIVKLDDPDLRRVVDGGRHVGVGQFDHFVEVVVQRYHPASDFESGNRPVVNFANVLQADLHTQRTQKCKKD
jgi:hypothetical protein